MGVILRIFGGADGDEKRKATQRGKTRVLEDVESRWYRRIREVRCVSRLGHHGQAPVTTTSKRWRVTAQAQHQPRDTLKSHKICREPPTKPSYNLMLCFLDSTTLHSSTSARCNIRTRKAYILCLSQFYFLRHLISPYIFPPRCICYS